MSTPAIEATGLSVGYRSRGGSRAVLADLDFAVQPGELVCLLGPNGIGKSTLLRTISRIQPPLAGRIRLGGVDLGGITQHQLARLLGVVLTERVQIGAMPAYRVVELGRYAHLDWAGRLTAADHEVVRWAIRAVGAEHLAHRDSSELSDGERQRIMIARALAQEPAVLLLDEPTAFLDVPSRVDLMGLLRTLARREGIAVVVSSHDLELALRTADTVWLVAPGGKFYAGAPEDIVQGGHVAEAFHGERIRFRPEERAFRLVGEGRCRALVEGEGLGAVLAAAVLEREGYEIVTERCPETLVVAIDAREGWRSEGPAAGTSFAALASFARSRGARTAA